jgi:hypothetical protein
MITRSMTKPRHPESDEAFRQGIQSVFRQWTALELAVSHQWGGPSSKEKADRLIEEIYEKFHGREKVYKDVSCSNYW